MEYLSHKELRIKPKIIGLAYGPLLLFGLVTGLFILLAVGVQNTFSLFLLFCVSGITYFCCLKLSSKSNNTKILQSEDIYFFEDTLKAK
jgi:hypothetical protein